jgi:hypothetical protein
MPAIFGTLVMTVFMSLLVTPVGVIAAIYLKEYAKDGSVLRIVRICVNNLAGVPSIVFGVFGLGFFVYVLGGTIDQLFFSDQLKYNNNTPVFGTGGLLWCSFIFGPDDLARGDCSDRGGFISCAQRNARSFPRCGCLKMADHSRYLIACFCPWHSHQE